MKCTVCDGKKDQETLIGTWVFPPLRRHRGKNQKRNNMSKVKICSCGAQLTNNEIMYAGSGPMLCFYCLRDQKQKERQAAEFKSQIVSEAHDKILQLIEKGLEVPLSMCCGECQTGHCLIIETQDQPRQIKLF